MLWVADITYIPTWAGFLYLAVVCRREDLDAVLARSDRAKGGRPPYDAVLMFKILVLQVLYGLSDDQAEFQILDRRSFGRFLGLDDGDRVPDAKTIWLFREQLTRAGAVQRLFDRFDQVLNDRPPTVPTRARGTANLDRPERAGEPALR